MCILVRNSKNRNPHTSTVTYTRNIFNTKRSKNLNVEVLYMKLRPERTEERIWQLTSATGMIQWWNYDRNSLEVEAFFKKIKAPWQCKAIGQNCLRTRRTPVRKECWTFFICGGWNPLNSYEFKWCEKISKTISNLTQLCNFPGGANFEQHSSTETRTETVGKSRKNAVYFRDFWRFDSSVKSGFRNLHAFRNCPPIEISKVEKNPENSYWWRGQDILY